MIWPPREGRGALESRTQTSLPSAHCAEPGCFQPTNERKPFCPVHLYRMAGYSRVLADVDARELEALAILAGGAAAVDVEGLRAQEVLWLLEDGPRTFEELLEVMDVQPLRIGMKPADEPARQILGALLAALERAGRVVTRSPAPASPTAKTIIRRVA